MPTATDDRAHEAFAPEDFERAWHGYPTDRKAGPSATPRDTCVTVVRNAPDDVQDRTMNLWLDGERWEPIRYGHQVTRAITPGSHAVKAHNQLVGATIKFDAAPGEHVRLRCVNQMSGGGMLLMLFIGVAPLRVRLERES